MNLKSAGMTSSGIPVAGGMIEAEQMGWQSIPGPKDRESFFTAQYRHHLATWRISALCLLAVLFMGVPLSILTAPLVWTLIILASDLISIVIPFPDLFSPLVAFLDGIINSEESQTIFSRQLTAVLLLSLASGSLTFLLLWLNIRRLLFRSGTAGILAQLKARESDKQDLEERQLVNIASEIAIAAGLPAPRVMLFDGDVANAAILGVSYDDATLVMSRRLLDDCDRDETQAVIAHLVGSAGNGDLRISMAIISIFLVLGMAMTLLNTAASRESRLLFGRLLRASLNPRGNPQEETALISDLMQAESAEIDEESSEGLGSQLRAVLKLPFLLLFMSFMVSKSIFGLFILGPALSHLWRTRRYLADATAVQLTRNPAGLAGALQLLSRSGGLVPGGHSLSHLFIVGEEIQQARAQQHFQARMSEIRKDSRGKAWFERLGTIAQACKVSQRQDQELHETADQSVGSNLGIPFSMLPPLANRLQRLTRMGADTTSADIHPAKHAHTIWTWVARAAGVLFIGPIAILVLMLIYSIMALSTVLGLGASMAVMMLMLSILHPLLRLL